MKKPAALILIAVALLSGGCNIGIPFSPLMFLLKNDSAPLPDSPPNNILVPAPVTSPEGTGDNNGAAALS